jgi:hypothetical protein
MGYGHWDDRASTPAVGTWFVVCNLGGDETKTVEANWDELHLSRDHAVLIAVDAESDSFSTQGGLELTPGERVTWTVPARGWIVGRLLWQGDPASVDMEDERTTDVEIWSAPQAPSGAGVLYVRSNAERLASVRIFDVGGRQVRDFGSVMLGRGTTPIPWNGTDMQGHRLPVGLYFATIGGPDIHRRVARLLVVR